MTSKWRDLDTTILEAAYRLSILRKVGVDDLIFVSSKCPWSEPFKRMKCVQLGSHIFRSRQKAS